MPFSQIGPQSRSELFARDGHDGEAPFIGRGQIMDVLDRNLDGLAADGDVDLISASPKSTSWRQPSLPRMFAKLTGAPP
jgi:hypothetical protein